MTKDELRIFLEERKGIYYRADKLAQKFNVQVKTIQEYLREMQDIHISYAQNRRKFGFPDLTEKKPTRWTKPFTPMTAESYKKHTLRGVVSV